MTTREQIVEEARRWLGTPYQHKGRIIGRCADCAAPIICVAHALGIEYDEQLDYGRVPNPRRMFDELAKRLTRITRAEVLPGDILFLSWKLRPHHLAIVTPIGMLHAFNMATPPRVVEHAISPDWSARIRGAFRFPGVE